MCTTPVLIYGCGCPPEPTNEVSRCDPALERNTQCAKPKKKHYQQEEKCARCTVKSEAPLMKASTAKVRQRCKELGATKAQLRSTKATREQMEQTVWDGQGWSFAERAPSQTASQTGKMMWDERGWSYMEVAPSQMNRTQDPQGSSYDKTGNTYSKKLGATKGGIGRTKATPEPIRRMRDQQGNYYEEDERSQYERFGATNAGIGRTKATPKPMTRSVRPDYYYDKYYEANEYCEDKGKSRSRR